MAIERRAVLLSAMLIAPPYILWLGAATDIDLALADAAFDRGAMTFPWRHAWLTEVFGHVLLKRLFLVLGAGWVMAGAWDLVAPRRWRAVVRARVRVVALSAILVPAAIALLKQVSASHCPWDLQRYGGAQPYLRLLESVPHGIVPGNCMPAGHASSALWMVSLAVLCLPARPRLAGVVALLLLALGFGVGWLQQLRGAHFLTHTLWSMWIACAIIGALYGLHFRAQAVRA
jgi:membrane-associated PAP2 superfamily phosphatase